MTQDTAETNAADLLPEDPPSRSQRKREMLDLQVLGGQLLALSPKVWESLPLTEELRAALVESLRIREKSAIKRHRKRLGKLLREADVAALRAHLEQGGEQQRRQTLHFQRLERWRDRLLSEGESALSELLTLAPQADRQQLRHWIRQAREEREQRRPPAAARKIFRYLRDLIPDDL